MIRISWDKYETAILVEASLKIISKEISRKDGILEVSNTLRQRALNKGKRDREVEQIPKITSQFGL